MSPRPELFSTRLKGVKRDAHGRIWIRARALAPSGQMQGIGWRLAREQGIGPEYEAIAFAERRELAAAIREGRVDDPGRERWTVRLWFEHIADPDVTPATASNREIRSRSWLAEIGDLDITAVGVADVERAWRAVQDEGLSPSTMSTALTYLRLPFHTAHKHGIIPRDPTVAAKLKIPPKRRSRDARMTALSGAELGPVLVELRKRDLFAAPYMGWFTAALVLWCTGMRRGELETAIRAHLEADGSGLWIPPDDEKTSRGRLVRMHPWLRAHIDEHIDRRGRVGDDEPLFAFARDGLTYRWKRALAANGMKYGRAHGTVVMRLRHSMRTTCQSLGFRERLLDLYLGHGDQIVTDTYSLAVVGELDEVAEAMTVYARRALQEAAPAHVPVDPVGYRWSTEEK